MTAPSTAGPVLELNLCRGTGLVTKRAYPGYRHESCPGCVGCDYDTVAARMADKIPADPFAGLPVVDDEEW